MISHDTRVAAYGIAAAIAQPVFGVNGPFLFNRFGLNVPEAVAAGCVVGAAVSCGVAEMILRIRHRRVAIAPVAQVRHEARPHAAA